MIKMLNKLRFARHDPHEITSIGPEPNQKNTRLDDCKKYDLVRMDILMINYKDTDAPNQIIQDVITPYRDGTFYVPERMKPFLESVDYEWLIKEAKLMAETAKQYPDYAKHLSPSPDERKQPMPDQSIRKVKNVPVPRISDAYYCWLNERGCITMILGPTVPENIVNQISEKYKDWKMFRCNNIEELRVYMISLAADK